LAEVAAEMSEIFALAGLGQAAPALRLSAAVAALRPSRGGGATVTLLAAATAGLVGLGAGAFVVRTPGLPAPPDAKLTAQSQPQAKTQTRAQSSASVVPHIALTEAAPTQDVAAAPGKPPSAQPPHSPAKAAAQSRSRFRTKLARLGGAQARQPIRLAEPVAQPASCEQDADSEDCRRAVVQADRHLRSVYQNAFERGVSRRVLVGYRDRWADLRERNTDEPATLIESYGALAYDLAHENADDQDSEPRPKGRSGLKALADLLLPWR
jgi:hypothetical protein